jgi:hypothetical protein
MSPVAPCPDVEPLPRGEVSPAALPPRRSGYRDLYLIRSPKPSPKRASPVGTVRRARVHTRTCRLESGYKDYPLIRLSGRWLDDAGFLQGQGFDVEVSEGRLVLRVV